MFVTENIESVKVQKLKKRKMCFQRSERSDVVYVQQDKAESHFNKDDTDMLEEGLRDWLSVTFKNQPAFISIKTVLQ